MRRMGKGMLKSKNEAIKNFPITQQFWNGDLNNSFLLIRKGVYPYEDMDSWEKFEETTIPPKEAFYSELKLENITDEDYSHVQKVWEVFIKNKRSRQLSWLVCSVWYIIACRCVWKL